ncbi:LysR family transcriptional regulator [Ramlibacter sp.]|uniref:LysR family transcriptional regulator n=1 Tax=Ramlibacter sp. TaxID=1917967 RepID=UPI003D132A4D
MAGAFNKIHLIRSVDLFTLKLFLTVVQEGQVGRAAAQENITASAATKRIRDLEEIVGVQLFERNPRGVLPTAAGRVLARYVTQVFGLFEDVRRDFSEFTEGVRGTIRVCATGGIISLYLAHEIAEFAHAFPMVDIDLSEGHNAEVIRRVAFGEVDVAVFVHTPAADGDSIDMLPYRADRLVAVVPRGHVLADREAVSVPELLSHNFIGIAPSTNLMSQIPREAAQAGVEFKPKYMVNSVYAATALVRVKQGVTIQPDNMLSAADLDLVQSIPLVEPWAKRQLVVGTARGRTQTVAARNFLAQLIGQGQVQ